MARTHDTRGFRPAGYPDHGRGPDSLCAASFEDADAADRRMGASRQIRPATRCGETCLEAAGQCSARADADRQRGSEDARGREALTLDEFIVRYEELTGVPACNRAWRRTFGGVKLGVLILVGAMLFHSGITDDGWLAHMGLGFSSSRRCAAISG